jgi:serine/threonine-protein phosphatase Stp1
MYQKTATGKMAASTVVVLLAHGGMAACLWAGDSRCYILRGGVLYQCTKDHSLRQEKIDKGELTRFEVQRMVKGNIITNAVGVKPDLTLGEEVFPLRAGDRYLLCTDGLTNLLSPDALMTYLSRLSAKEAVEGIAGTLEDMGQPDNITFVAIFVSELE